MKDDKLLREQLKNLDVKNPENSLLVKQLLEYRAINRDNEATNQLLHDLVLKYAAAEKKLVNLNRELLEKQNRLDEDLEAAAKIQRSLLPRKINSVENFEVAWNFEPCKHIGGDIFNIIRLDGDHWLIYMLDVSGHGVPAALVAASVSNILQPHTGYILKKVTKSLQDQAIIQPHEVLETLNREYPLERFNNFFTITYIIFDTASGQLTYSNAGHPYPILLRKNGELTLMRKGGPIIGVIESHSSTAKQCLFGGEQLTMDPGDKLFVYTDGVIEYQNQDKELYGSERFYNQLKEFRNKSVFDMVEIVLKSLMNFGNQTKPQDDISLLGLELKNLSS
jgi:sigma-B regulation protein RsbU (phosphoserine phosphatase)